MRLNAQREKTLRHIYALHSCWPLQPEVQAHDGCQPDLVPGTTLIPKKIPSLLTPILWYDIDRPGSLHSTVQIDRHVNLFNCEK